jgi:hypothetical protein
MNETKTGITLRVGGTYRARNGDIRGPMRENTSGRCYVFTDGHHSWRKGGVFHVSGMPSPRDLLSEIIPAPHRSSLIYGAAMVGDVPAPVKDAIRPVTVTISADTLLQYIELQRAAECIACSGCTTEVVSMELKKLLSKLPVNGP